MSVKLALQYRDKSLFPATDADKEQLNHLIDFQIVKAQISVPQDQQIIRDQALYWKICSAIAETSGNEYWNTQGKVDLHVRSVLKFYNPEEVIKRDNCFIISPWSISASNLSKIKEHDFFTRAFELMAKAFNCPVNDLRKIGYKHHG